MKRATLLTSHLASSSPPATVEYAPTSILLTGGAGFIGSCTAIELCREFPDCPLVVLDRLDYCASLKNLEDLQNHSNFKLVKGDLLEANLLRYIIEQEAVDTIIHMAAQTHVDNSFNNSMAFTRDNAMGTQTLLEVARTSKHIKRFIHISTDEVYGHSAAGRDFGMPDAGEGMVLEPTNPYAASKAAAEYLAMSYFHSFKLPIIITRGNNVYGPRQYPEKLIPKCISLLQRGSPVFVHGVGDAKRNFLYVEDCARAVITLLRYGTVGQIYNIGGDIEESVLSVVKTLIGLFNATQREHELIVFVADRAFNDVNYAIDCKKLGALGWRPQVSWEDGLQRTIDWYCARDVNAHWEAGVDHVLIPHPQHRIA